MAKGIFKRGTVWWVRYAGIDGRIVREAEDILKTLPSKVTT
jgi:hypothetical protein